jgi:hypothetical protein
MAISDIDAVNSFKNPQDGIRSFNYRKSEQEDWVKWLSTINWKSLLTLTYDDKKHSFEVLPEHAEKHWRDLVRVLNIGVFGPQYAKKCHHSYFGYLKAMEWQKRGVIHMHVLIDNYVNYELILRHWSSQHGFAQISSVGDSFTALEYMTKYVMKGGSEYLNLYQSKKKTIPMFKPEWWQKAESRAAAAACETLDAASEVT